MINQFISTKKTISYRIIWMLFVVPSCVFSANELYRRCNQTFSCGDQRDLFYPFWISGREDCGIPDFKLECNTSFAEISISSIKFRILEVNYTSRIIRLTRLDYIDDLCPQNPPSAQFNESVLPFAPETEMLTLYYGCGGDFSPSVSTYVRELDCEHDDRRNYYVMSNLSSSSLTQEMSGLLYDLRGFCSSNLSIPTSRPALDTLQRTPSKDNLRNVLKEGFKLQLNQECSMCIDSGGACGYKQSSSGFTFFWCHSIDAGLPTGAIAEEVGRGGFGIVYRGTLCDGRIVAVKVLKDSKGNNGEDFRNEVASMSQTSHVNVVTLLGFCSEGSKRAILYEFLENGSLEKFISSNTTVNLNWTALYRIALGVARGLEYLHHGCRTRIVHFDIKPQNVLLDDNLSPKVSDFGLAKLCDEEEIATKMKLVGLWCIQSSPSDRPAMNKVVEMMEGNLDALEVPPRPVLQIPAASLQESSIVSQEYTTFLSSTPINTWESQAYEFSLMSLTSRLDVSRNPSEETHFKHISDLALWQLSLLVWCQVM